MGAKLVHHRRYLHLDRDDIGKGKAMNSKFVWFALGIAAYFVYVHYVAKVPTAAAKPGNGG
jgi:hypothetical protein